MQKETTYSGILGEWQRLEVSLALNAGDVPHLEPSRQIFVTILNQAKNLTQEQAALAAEKQRVSQELKQTVVDGQRLATMLRQGLKQYYGIRSEKLTEFGLRPYRGRTGRKDPAPPPPPPVEATAPSDASR